MIHNKRTNYTCHKTLTDSIIYLTRVYRNMDFTNVSKFRQKILALCNFDGLLLITKGNDYNLI